MTDETNDPYTLYLGLPAGARPPHYYELLGIELFCSQHARINQAVRKRFRIIKCYHDLPDRQAREAVQDIMNAIATSRVVLTDPQAKDEYDAALAAELGIDRDAHLAAQLAVPLPEFEVTVVAGPSLVEHRFEISEGAALSIGTGENCTIVLDPGRAEAEHCAIAFEGGEWLLKPASSKSPVRIEGTVVGEYVLADGDLFDVAGYRMLFSSIARRDDVRAAHAVGPPLSLIIQKGPSIPNAVFNVLPPQRFTVGHGDDACWQLADQTVSQIHCAVQSVGDRWEIEDLDSTNGTRVNGVEVLRHLLSDRDVITLGKFDILVSVRF